MSPEQKALASGDSGPVPAGRTHKPRRTPPVQRPKAPAKAPTAAPAAHTGAQGGSGSSGAGRSSGGAGGGKTARIVRTEAGARRYGVAVGQPYTDGKVPQRGARSPKVLAAKQQLVKLGMFADLGAEGINGPGADLFGPRLEAGLRTFQRRQGLPVTGKLDPVTAKRLDTVAGRRDGSGSSSSSSSGSGSGSSSSSSGGSSGGGSAAARENRQIDRMANRIQSQQTSTVKVKPGDTLWGIAQRELGDGSRWKEIAQASGLGKDFDPTKLQPGTKLTIPPKKPTEGVGPKPRAGSGRAGGGAAAYGGGRKLTQAAAVDLFHSLPPNMQQAVLKRAREILAAQRPAAG